MENLPMISALVGVAGVVFAAILAGVVKGAPAGNEKMREIADAISEGAIAYLNRQLITMSMTGIVIFVIIWLSIDLKTGVGFLVGAVASFIAGYIGMRVSVLASTETRIPMYPAMKDATAPTRKPTPVFKSMLNQMMTKITIPVMDMVIN